MRRIFGVILTALLLLAMPRNVSVFAASSTYDLDELGLQLTIPSGYSVITRDTPSDASIFSDFGITKADVTNHFETSNIYLNAISDTYNEEIVVTKTVNIIDNLNSYNDTTLNSRVAVLYSIRCQIIELHNAVL